ncbi:MAG: hypothetical protein H0T56_09765 [Pseudaminobacter sp.]|nr:hypothetical protein [Pseudaminobacter sp.]
MSQRRSKTARPGKSPDKIKFSEKDAAFLRQLPGFYKEFPPAEIDEATGELYLIPALEELLVLALRFASTLNGAPERCRNQSCGKGRCHLRLGANGDGVCQGGIGERTMEDAARMLGFLAEVGKRYCPRMFA